MGALKTRHSLAFWLFVSLTVLYTHRVSFNVALVVMVEPSARSNALKNTSCSCADNRPNTTSLSKSGTYNWGPWKQGLVVGAFYHGYSISQILGGSVSNYFGTKFLFVTTIFASSIFTFLVPWVAPMGFWFTVVARQLTGFVQGLAYTSVYTIFGYWVPPDERSTLLAMVMTGNHMGSVIGMTVTGYLCEYGFAGGWPSAFVILSLFSFLVGILTIFTIYSTPLSHPRVSRDERDYILSSLQYDKSIGHVTTIPWRAILTSGPVWAVTLTKACLSWGFYTLLTRLPMYLDAVLHISIRQNGLFNAMIFAALSSNAIISGIMADWLIRKGYFSRTTVRKIFETLGLFIPGVCLTLIPYFGCDVASVLITLIVALGCYGLVYGGDNPTVVDLAPDYAGTIFGLSNGFSSGIGIIAPIIAGHFVEENNGSLELWSIVFYISSAFFFIGAIIFDLFGTADVQPWSSLYQKGGADGPDDSDSATHLISDTDGTNDTVITRSTGTSRASEYSNSSSSSDFSYINRTAEIIGDAYVFSDSNLADNVASDSSLFPNIDSRSDANLMNNQVLAFSNSTSDTRLLSNSSSFSDLNLPSNAININDTNLPYNPIPINRMTFQDDFNPFSNPNLSNNTRTTNNTNNTNDDFTNSEINLLNTFTSKNDSNQPNTTVATNDTSPLNNTAPISDTNFHNNNITSRKKVTKNDAVSIN